ncbi:MAG: ATP-binding protein [Acidobacteriota bacterium]
MTRARHFLITALAGLPILVVGFAATSSTPSNQALIFVFWLAAVGFAGEVVWRRSQQPVTTLISDLGLNSIHQVSHRLGKLQDEAERCRTERTEMSQLINDISTGLGEGLLVVDPDLHVRLCNPRAQHFLGAESLRLGASLLDVERSPDIVDGIRSAVDGQTGKRILVENPRGVWELRSFPLSQGGAVVLVTEVGSLRRAAELRRRFVQDLSHELRSPLAVMRTTVEALEDEVPHDIARMMVRQVERITRLTDELYELASIEAGTLKMKTTHQSIVPVVRQVASDFAAVASRAEVDLRTDLPEDFSFDFDTRALTRVLCNLVDNAIKYNRAGGWVKITASRLGNAAQIEVEDSGLGIPAPELSAVLQRFYRVDRARTPGTGGLGLGLAIVKHMVQLMGGELNLDSREDVGTRVTVSFPLASTATE